MGGTAFVAKYGLSSERMDVNTYYTVLNKVLKQLGNVIHEVIPHVREKQDFGDIDILVLGHDAIAKINERFSEYKIIDAGDGVSVLFEDKYQIDFIKTQPHEIDQTITYFGYNDFGNLIGRMAKKFDLKYAHNGLFYRYRDGNHYKKDVLLTYDHLIIFDILKLDVNTFLKGFDTFNDMFDFVSSSPYFNKSIYLFDNLNNKNRVRDRKRKTYHAFLKYCESLPDKEDIEYPVNLAFELFPDLQGKVDEIESTRQKINQLAEKFNGKIIMELTGLTGASLGDFIKSFKLKFDENTLYALNADEIKLLIMDDFNVRN